MSEKAMSLKCTGVGDLYQVRLQRRIRCLEFGVELTAGSMMAHRRPMQGNEPVIDWIWQTVSHTVQQPQLYDMIFTRMTKKCTCPLPGFLGSSRTWNALRSHFKMQHWGDRIRIMEEHPNPLPRCERCGCQVPTGRLSNRHYMSEKCNQGGEVTLGARTYNTDLRQVGSCSILTPRPYHSRRHSHTWGGQ